MTLAQVLSGERHGVFRWTDRDRGRGEGAVDEAEAAAGRAGWRWVLLDSTAATDKPSFLDVCAEAFDLPTWFGRNWDGLDECMRGLDLDEPVGLLVLWTGWAGLAEADPDAFDCALEVFRDACVAWDDDDVPGAVLLAGDGPDADLPDL
jgi:hypothetical protein